MGSKRKAVERDADGSTVRVGVLVNGIECIVRENNEFTEYIPTRGVISNRPFMVIVAGGIPNEMKLKCEKALTFSFPSIGMKLLKPTSTTVGRMAVLEDFVKARANVNREYLDAFNEAYKAIFGSSCMKYCTKELLERKELVMLGSYISRDLMEEKVKVETHTPMIGVCLNADYESDSLYHTIHNRLYEGDQKRGKIVWKCGKSNMELCKIITASQNKKEIPKEVSKKEFDNYIEISSDDE
ncbi:hypothetical protein OROGR_009055 [Orobanche gracilis]